MSFTGTSVGLLICRLLAKTPVDSSSNKPNIALVNVLLLMMYLFMNLKLIIETNGSYHCNGQPNMVLQRCSSYAAATIGWKPVICYYIKWFTSK